MWHLFSLVTRIDRKRNRVPRMYLSIIWVVFKVSPVGISARRKRLSRSSLAYCRGFPGGRGRIHERRIIFHRCNLPWRLPNVILALACENSWAPKCCGHFLVLQACYFCLAVCPLRSSIRYRIQVRAFSHGMACSSPAHPHIRSPSQLHQGHARTLIILPEESVTLLIRQKPPLE